MVFGLLGSIGLLGFIGPRWNRLCIPRGKFIGSIGSRISSKLKAQNNPSGMAHMAGSRVLTALGIRGSVNRLLIPPFPLTIRQSIALLFSAIFWLFA